MPAASASWPTSSSRWDSGSTRHAERVGAVGDRAVSRDADVDRDQVALLDDPPVRDPVDDDLVHRDADRARVALVAERGGDAAVRADERVGDVVELERRDARLEPFADVRDRLGDEAPAGAIRSISAGALADDHARRRSCPSRGGRAPPRSPSATCVDRALGVERHELPGRAVVARRRARSARGRSRGAWRSPRECRRRGPPPARVRGSARARARRQVEEEDGVERPADLGEHRLERVRLGDVPREAVQDEAGRSVGLGEPLADSATVRSSGTSSPRARIGSTWRPSSALRSIASRNIWPVERGGSHAPPRSVRPGCLYRSPVALGREVHGS